MDPTFRAYSAHNHILPHTWGVAPGYCISHRSEEHTSELQSRSDLVCRLLLEKKKKAFEWRCKWVRSLPEGHVWADRQRLSLPMTAPPSSPSARAPETTGRPQGINPLRAGGR